MPESCPLCAAPLDGLLCSACGYDGSADALRYPTLAPLPESARRRNAAPAAAQKKSLEQLAYEGDPEAECSLGLRFLREGRNEQGFELLKKAALQKNAEACWQLGLCYEHGLGCESSESLASAFLRRASTLGHARASAALADRYLSGKGVPRDLNQAEQLYVQAAMQGFPDGLSYFARRLQDGEGVPRRKKKAEELLQQAARYGSREAGELTRQLMEEKKNELRQAAAAAQTQSVPTRQGAAAAAQATAAAAQAAPPGSAPKAGEKKSPEQLAYEGEVAAQYSLGLKYLQEGRSRQGFELLSKAALQGNAEACRQLARCYEQGLGCEQSDTLAASFLRRASALGHARASAALADRHLSGKGVPRDLDQAEQLYVQAAMQGFPDGLYYFARRLQEGEGIPRRKKKAEELLHQAARYGSREATALLQEIEEEKKQKAAASAAQRAAIASQPKAAQPQTKAAPIAEAEPKKPAALTKEERLALKPEGRLRLRRGLDIFLLISTGASTVSLLGVGEVLGGLVLLGVSALLFSRIRKLGAAIRSKQANAPKK